MINSFNLAIGEQTYKLYKCDGCAHEFEARTNHWGPIHCACPQCHNRGGTVSHCLEPCADTYGLPDEWGMVTIADLVD